jgi:hypothetical protein
MVILYRKTLKLQQKFSHSCESLTGTPLENAIQEAMSTGMLE